MIGARALGGRSGPEVELGRLRRFDVAVPDKVEPDGDLKDADSGDDPDSFCSDEVESPWYSSPSESDSDSESESAAIALSESVSACWRRSKFCRDFLRSSLDEKLPDLAS